MQSLFLSSDQPATASLQADLQAFQRFLGSSAVASTASSGIRAWPLARRSCSGALGLLCEAPT